MRLKSFHLGLLVFLILFGGIMTASAFNLWHTEGSRTPARYAEGEFMDEYNPDDIRGSYTFGDVSTLFKVPLDDLRIAFGLPKGTDVANFQNKELEGLFSELEEQGMEVGNNSVKLFVALYTGLPFSIDEDIYLPQPAVELLRSRGDLSAEQIAYVDVHTVEISGIQPDVILQEEPAGGPPDNNGQNEPQNIEAHDDSERLIKGKTTFREVLDWGVPEEIIENIIGASLPNPILSIRDFCIENGLAFGEIKGAIQIEVDKVGE
jgi:hypothetical protein